MLKKSVWAQRFLFETSANWRCPYCCAPVTINKSNGMTCQNQHHFNLSKKGTMHLMKQPANNDYDRSLFEARRHLMQAGFFDPILRAIAAQIQPDITPLLLVDIGCGEGTHLVHLQQLVPINSQRIVGIDIAKEAILQASRDYAQQAFWCWADLTNLPFQNQSCAYLLNILSPSHYREFNRVLAPGGKLIKVIPNVDYLKEIRLQVAKSKPELQHYSNQEVLNRFYEAYPNATVKSIRYMFPLTDEMYAHLIQMTPLMWHLTKQERNQLQLQALANIMVDVLLLVGQK